VVVSREWSGVPELSGGKLDHGDVVIYIGFVFMDSRASIIQVQTTMEARRMFWPLIHRFPSC
jgi:hypothetical protein